MNGHLAKFRKEINLSQEEIARKMDISTSYYVKVENDIKPPSYNFIKKFKNTFPEQSIEFFFEKHEHVE